MAAVRNNIQDFMAAVRARGINGGTSKNVYGCSLNADNTTVKITLNGAVLYPQVLWPGPGNGAGVTDASAPNGDTVGIFGGEGSYSVGSAQAFINSLL